MCVTVMLKVLLNKIMLASVCKVKNQSKDQVLPLIYMTESSLASAFLEKSFLMSKK